MIKRVIFSLIFCFSIFSSKIFAFRMMGLNYNKSLEDGYREFTIHNDGMKRERYRIILTPSGDEDITDCLEVYPKIITIEPKSYKTFKIFGVAKRKLEKKEYSFNVNFNPIVIPTIKKYEGNAVTGTASLGFAPSIGLKAFGGKIDYAKDIIVENLVFTKKDKLKIAKCTIFNSSQGTLELGVLLSDNKDNVYASKAIGNIAPKSRVTVDIELNDFKEANMISKLEFYDDTGKTIFTKSLK